MPGDVSRNLPAAELDDGEGELLRQAGTIEALRTALADALEGLEDMLPYVPDYFREKWEHQGYIDRARAALAEVAAEHTASCDNRGGP